MEAENARLMNENQFYLRKMKKMRKEIERLKAEVNDRVAIEDIADAFGSDKGDDFDWESEIYGVVQENKRLKEELEEKDAHWNDWLNKEFGDGLYPISPSPEPDEFVRKVKAQKEDLLYYRFYAYTLDRSGDCDLTKEDVDYFTDDPALRKTLYERIGYEQESYKSFGVMFVEKEDGDEDDIDFFDTLEEAQKLCNKILSSNNTSPHPYPEGKLIVFRSHDYNPDIDNENTIPIVREMEIGTDAITNLDSLLGQLKNRINEKTRK